MLRGRAERNTDFVSFVTILPIFAAKRPDYIGQISALSNLNRIVRKLAHFSTLQSTA